MSEKKKRSKPFPANNESRKWLEARGWTVDTVEQTLPYGFIKRDCFGFADLLAFHPERGIVLVQSTAGAGRGNANKRLEKIRANPSHVGWLKSGGRIQVHNWLGEGKHRELEVLEVTMETK